MLLQVMGAGEHHHFVAFCKHRCIVTAVPSQAQMGMAVDQTGRQGCVAEVDGLDLGWGIADDFSRWTDGSDAALVDNNGLICLRGSRETVG